MSECKKIGATFSKHIFTAIAAVLLFNCSSPSENANASASSVKDEKSVRKNNAISTDTIQIRHCEMTCPSCGYTKTETMPTDICVLKYTCEKCKSDLQPKDGDCCVYCSYGDHQCPSMQ